MKYSARQNVTAGLAAVAGIAGVTALCKFEIVNVNATTVALSFLLVVLVVSSARGLVPGMIASIAGMLCFNFFFLPPFGTLTIQDPQNWMALFAFVVTAIIASQLSATAASRAREAEQKREELLKLYQLSQSIIVSPDPEMAIPTLTRQVVTEFEAECCAVFTRREDGEWQKLAAVRDPYERQDFAPSMNAVEDCFVSGGTDLSTVSIQGEGRGQTKNLAYAPLRVGVKSIGVIVLLSAPLERTTVEAIAGLVALALERTKFLKEVSRTEALRQSDELKSALLASVSHDLRTPLTSIRAAVDSLLQKEANWDGEQLSEFHSIISEEVERLSKLVQNLLEMARIEAGELQIANRWTAVSEIIANVLERCRVATRNRRVIVDVDDRLPLVKVDSTLVAQALSHLVENAAKYSPEGSEITIRGRADKQTLLLYVEDQGAGIPPDELNRVFDKFYRAAAQRQAKGGGTGMGLSIARGIIEAHGGRIWVENRAGQGAVFTFEIPVEVKVGMDYLLMEEEASERTA